MTTRSNTITDFAFCHIPTGTLYDLSSRPRYNNNLNIYSDAWQLHAGLIFATAVNDSERLLAVNVSRAELTTRAAQAMNELAEQL